MTPTDCAVRPPRTRSRSAIFLKLFGYLVGAGTILWLSLFANPSFAQPEVADVKISYQRIQRSTLTLDGSAPVSKQSDENMKDSIQGGEQSQCRPREYGRRSASSVSTAIDIKESEGGRLSALLKASALANGGHYRTCATCDPIGRNCIGIMGHDTRASATAHSQLQAKLVFSAKILQSPYNLRLSSNLPKDVSVRVTLADGSTMIPRADGLVSLNVKPNDVIYVDAALATAASDSGGCCSDQKDLAVQFDLRIEKAALLASRKGLKPFIAGGKETTSYKSVVGILLDGDLHCSGTVIGARTIITAAHCISGYENRIQKGDMAFIIGSNAGAPETGPFPISSGVYPRGTDPIQYTADTHAHDVGLLFTTANIPVGAVGLHKPDTAPLWSDLINKTNLLFVGFGYNTTSDGDKVGLGVKREASWMANNADDWRFYFNAANANTCKGDSGGPAFYLNPDTRVLALVGLTSVGDENCTLGADTRVDTHYGWISTRIQ